MRIHHLLILAASILLAPLPSLADTAVPPTPYTTGGNRLLLVNGKWLPKDAVFRCLPVTLPLASIRVTSLYGMRVNPFTHTGTEFHPGLDLGAPTGTTVYSTAAGIVTFVGSRGDYGNMVEVVHGLGFRTRYSHLSRFSVGEGQVVDRNTPLGEVGSTGRSSGPHLYWEIWNQQVRVDPVEFVIRAYEVYHHLN